MKSTVIFLVLNFVIAHVQGQLIKSLDTLYANETKNVALFFPNPIRQGITGSANFAFTYNREKEQFFGLLQATPGEDSNLLVVCADGQVYSYILSFDKNLEKFNYFIDRAESIGNERFRNDVLPARDTLTDKEVIPTESEMNPLPKSLEPSKTDYLERSCISLLKLPNRKNYLRKNQKVSLGIKNMVYYGAETFIVIQMENASGIDFEVDFLNIYRVNGNNKRKASYQETWLKPIFIYGLPKNLMNGSVLKVVYVLPKFTLAENERLTLRLKEIHGSRSVELKLK